MTRVGTQPLAATVSVGAVPSRPVAGDGDDVDGRWLLLDLDGTLLDYRRASEAALRATLTEIGVEDTATHRHRFQVLNDRRWHAYERGGITVAELRRGRWADLLDEVGAAVDPAAASDVYVGHLARQAQLVDGALEMLTAAAGRFRLGLITNGFADVQRPRLAASGVLEHAEVIVISDEVGAAKPDRAIFEAAFSRMGGPPREQVTIVGDSLRADVAGGLAYGIDAIWFNPRARAPGPEAPRPTHEIAALDDLLTLLDGDRGITPVRG